MINNTIPNFLRLWENNDIALHDLYKYYDTYPDVFGEYFKYHCPKTTERLSNAIQKYPDKLKDICMISEDLPWIIREVREEYRSRFEIELDLNFNLIVGGFGSNAFVEREIIGQIFFAAEKLSPELNHLRVIVAHEIGHVYHNVLLQENGMAWNKAEWTDATVNLYREGVATYLSKKVVKGLDDAVYYSYNNEGEQWLQCYKNRNVEIKKRFLEDYNEGGNVEKEKEWFRLSGGNYFGYNRLGYFLGTSYVEYLVEKFGEEQALAFWCMHDLKSSVMEWLQR
ncbi:aminopeptidase [Bacillus clarus]|uniref:Aminopeptidase n=1 Tax=Bacillus clarus TaxID=2338372 RepID=A0A090YWL8_9BACI|nr:aminopeptidase [Bacillus clarus]KFN03309.1 peptidase MA superfamily protein [Bacillus clarus]RFT63281.1 aminopeptidase [Bacillus clarus]